MPQLAMNLFQKAQYSDIREYNRHHALIANYY